MKNIWLIGDIHGDWTVVRNFYVKHKEELSDNYEDNVLVVLGDFGALYYLNKRDDFFKEKLHKFPLTYFCIRGNHEQRPSIQMLKYPADWHYERYFENRVYVEDRFPKIKYALDEGGKYIIEGKSVLTIPGAYSVDKWYRIMNHWSWFENEQLSYEERQELLEYQEPRYDCIFAHTCPYMWIPYIQDLFLPQVDQSMVDNTTEYFLNEIVARCDYDRFYFGHYHDNRDLHEFATMIYHEAIPFGSSYSMENLKNYKNML